MTTTVQPEPTRHTNLWFEDGNIVLVAQHTAFRVHRTVLAMHSNVFRDMFLIPQPATVDESIDGCPVVRMVEDSAEEVEIVLRILYGADFK